MLKSVPPFWRPTIKASIGDPDEDREFLIEHSPITYVHQLKVPLMVVQGAMDPRVPRPSPTSWWSGSAPWAGRWSTWSSRTRATASPSVRTC
ncbi:conserved domain protein [Symbiobacterium thermophilum IAM 14863]|uniref:Conserved domain protein n=2 Tax=Symbiobacterium thermophilum TaxID=2734 RepID=Q67MK7_SYMTH|nr:conserved domain protein [Symbiobacterium thermophilum IAM 14863]